MTGKKHAPQKSGEAKKKNRGRGGRREKKERIGTSLPKPGSARQSSL